MTPRAARLSIILLVLVAAAIAAVAIAIVLSGTASAAPADACDPAYTAQCCACDPSDAAEPNPLPHVYLPSVLLRMPSMPPPEFNSFVPPPQLQPERPMLRWVWLAWAGK